MDLANYDCEALAEEGIKCDSLIGPDGKALISEHGVVSFVVAGKDSRRWNKAAKKMKSKYAGRKQTDLTMDEVTETAFEILAQCIISWENVYFKSEPLECNLKHAKMLICGRGYKWLAEQLLTIANDRSRLLFEQPVN